MINLFSNVAHLHQESAQPYKSSLFSQPSPSKRKKSSHFILFTFLSSLSLTNHTEFALWLETLYMIITSKKVEQKRRIRCLNQVYYDDIGWKDEKTNLGVCTMYVWRIEVISTLYPFGMMAKELEFIIFFC